MFQVTYSDGDLFPRNGRTYRVNIEPDEGHGAPWDECDGHGPVSEWTTRDKRPGEWLLRSDRGHKRYYDAQEAMRIALRDGWGLSDAAKAELVQRLARPRVLRRAVETVTIPGRDPAKPLTKREIAAEAVRRDFEYLRRWCNDQWSYVGVIVTDVTGADDPDDVETDYTNALWGVESDCEEYIAEVAHELADAIVAANRTPAYARP